MSRHSHENVDPLENVDPELRDRYLTCEQEKGQLEKTEKELDELITLLEQQKKDICSDYSYTQYAYVTYKDLQKLPLWRQSSNQDGSEDQSLVIAIQTPHGSLLNIFQ